MTEMNPISRFFVNLSAARRSSRVYRWILEDVPGSRGARWLEVGCGNGALASRIVEGLAPARYVATDIDSHQLDVARRSLERRFSTAWPTALELKLANMVDLPFDPASFDRVIAMLTIHHAGADHHDFGAASKALAQFDRVLTPGGRIVYEEFLHKEAIRSWLVGHGYTIERRRGRLRVEFVVARKPPLGGSSGVTDAPGAISDGASREARP